MIRGYPDWWRPVILLFSTMELKGQGAYHETFRRHTYYPSYTFVYCEEVTVDQWTIDVKKDSYMFIKVTYSDTYGYAEEWKVYVYLDDELVYYVYVGGSPPIIRIGPLLVPKGVHTLRYVLHWTYSSSVTIPDLTLDWVVRVGEKDYCVEGQGSTEVLVAAVNINAKLENVRFTIIGESGTLKLYAYGSELVYSRDISLSPSDDSIAIETTGYLIAPIFFKVVTDYMLFLDIKPQYLSGVREI